jgi:hypothetical protein
MKKMIFKFYHIQYEGESQIIKDKTQRFNSENVKLNLIGKVQFKECA